MSSFDILSLICAIGCGMVAGVFFAFSTSVMKALAKLPAEHGIAAMQGINALIINPLFLGIFLGTAIACALMLLACLLRYELPGRLMAVSAAAVYIVGSFLVTMLFNVPRNNMLARLIPTSSEAATVWKEYVAGWTAWNHVRTFAALAAAVLFMLATFRS
ncbi:MAG TPA: anthrone oxygenase family protein [Bryobacteraceae bacterium]|nr:anthrone oxygenase family protein [Bryobacteraceae bacterium]